MLYKLYKNLFREAPPSERRELFGKLYEEHGVELIGVWKNKDNPLEYYMMTKYRDEEHHRQFTEAAKKNHEYLQMTQRINEARISSESTNLILEEY